MITVRPLNPDDAALAAVDRLVASDPARGLAGVDTRPDDQTAVLGGFVGEDELVCFGVFRDYRDPRLHVGNQVANGPLRDVMALEGVGLYQICLLHADTERVEDAEAATALIEGFEQWLGARFGRYCLFITLLKTANKQARPLYKRLGFKKSGRGSSLMRFDLKRLERRLKRIKALPETLEPRFFDAATDADRRSFAECYRHVFMDEATREAVDVEDALRLVTDAPGFWPELSLLLLDRAGGHVVGFMLADRAGPDRMHIGVAGLLPEARGQRLPYRCLPPIAWRALEREVRYAHFVTVQKRVARLTLRAFGAREVERMQTYYKVG